MNILPIDASEDEIKFFIIEWNQLMAQEKYAEALNMIPYDIFYSEVNWTPELLKSVVYGYGIIGMTREEVEKEFGSADYKITSIYTSKDKQRILDGIDISYEYKWVKDGDLGVIYYDVPLNDEISDLTARFIIRKLDKKTITLVFMDLHVM